MVVVQQWARSLKPAPITSLDLQVDQLLAYALRGVPHAYSTPATVIAYSGASSADLSIAVVQRHRVSSPTVLIGRTVPP